MHYHLDTIGGIAGDMLAAALLDYHPEWKAVLAQSIQHSGLAFDLRLRALEHNDGILFGHRFEVAETQDSDLHQHRRWRDIRHLLSLCQLDAPVKQRALAIFELLAEAEAKVHGCAVDEVVFHEVGAWDSIADIVAAAWLIERSGATSNAISEIQPSDRIPADVGHGRASDRTARSHCDDVPGDGHFFCTPYGANIRTHRMILLSNNIAVSLFLQ